MDADHAIALLAERQHGVVSRPQALRCGLTSSGIARRVELEQWERLHQGVYRLTGTQRTFDQHVQAACLAAGGRAIASHGSAAYLLRLPLDNPAVEITIEARRWLELRGVTVHRSRSLDRVDTLKVRGIPATSVARTLIDLASELPSQQLAGVVDHALANRLIPIAYLRHRLDALGHVRDGTAALARLTDSPRFTR